MPIYYFFSPRFSIACLLFISGTIAHCQNVINVEYPQEGLVKLSEETSIPKIASGYTLWLPEEGQAKGLIVFTRARRDTVRTDFLIDYALQNKLGVLYATTSNRVDFFFDTSSMREIEEYIYEALSRHGIPKSHLLYCGMSLEGTRALKLAIFGQSAESTHHFVPAAIAICDAPLDMVRFHASMVRAKQGDYHKIAANEGAWVSAYLESRLGGGPDKNMAAYVRYAPFTYAAGGGPHLGAFMDIPLRAYAEPDVNWWMETRRKDYYDMNATDLAALVNALNILGNNRAELITTTDRGYQPDGTRHPHSWSIVDEKGLVDWFLGIISE